MGESVLGLPNRFCIINNLLESTYNPNHALSAYMGNHLLKKFNDYLPLTGGSVGPITSQSITPVEPSKYDIGSELFKYASMYADNFNGDLNGNADSSSKLKSAVKIQLTGSVSGTIDFDGSNDVTIVTSTAHNHDELYMKLSGGQMTGNFSLGKDSAIIGNTNKQILSLTTDNKLKINMGPYNDKVGTTIIYSTGDLDVRTHSAGMMITSSLFDKTVNVGTSADSVYLENTVNNDFLHITDDGKLVFNEDEVYHHGNFKPENLLYSDYKNHINDVKKVIKVLTILLDQLEVQTGVKETRDYPESTITDQLEYYKKNAIEILDQ